MVLAGESSINKLSDGCWITNVIYNDNQWHFSSILSVNLIGQIRQVQLQLLWKQRKVILISLCLNLFSYLCRQKTHFWLITQRCYLLWLTMHVEGDGSAATQDTGLTVGLRRVSPAALQEVVGQTLSQVSLSRPAGPRQNQPPVL